MKDQNKKQKSEMPDSVEQLYIPSAKAVCMVFAFVCAAFVPINLGVHNMMMVYINGAISLMMLLGYISILKSGTMRYAVLLIMSVLIIVTIQYLITGGEDGFSILWILLIPPFAIYILDLRKAVVVSLFIWSIVLLGLWTPLNDYCYDYNRTFEIRFPILYAAEIAVAVMIKKKISQVEKKRDELLKINIQYKNDAEKANRAKSDFLASMSHEIRTPINAVLGMNEMILRESTEEPILEYASNVDSSGRFLLSLINDILDISKIESGKMELICTDYSLSALLNDVMQMAYSRAEEKAIKIYVEVSPDTPEQLYGDNMKIRQVLTNMMTNAIKYTDAGGTAVLLVSGQYMDDDRVWLHMGVKDNGKGIKKEDIEKLFDAFQRVDETSNQAIEGTGLGLSISRSYIRMMDGELQVESEYGKGSYFHFHIPQQVRGNEPIGEFEKRYGAHHAESGAYRRKFAAPDAKILVVDDDEMNRAVVKGLLKQTKVQMDFAESGEQCLERMAVCHYDVILLDHMMPGMDGMETLAEMRKRYPNENAKVIALTANAISGMRQMYLDSGFDDYMTKPIDGGALEKLLMNYIPEEKLDQAAAGEKEPTGLKSGANPKKKAAFDEGENGSISLSELQEWKTAVPELDVLLGLEYSIGDMQFYTEMLRMFAEQSKLPMLNEHYGHADWGQYHTLVHALKSTALSIGFVRLSEQARQLEYAAKRSDAAYITLFHSEVMEYYGECIRHIQVKLAGSNGEV